MTRTVMTDGYGVARTAAGQIRAVYRAAASGAGTAPREDDRGTGGPGSPGRPGCSSEHRGIRGRCGRSATNRGRVSGRRRGRHRVTVPAAAPLGGPRGAPRRRGDTSFARGAGLVYPPPVLMPPDGPRGGQRPPRGTGAASPSPRLRTAPRRGLHGSVCAAARRPSPPSPCCPSAWAAICPAPD